MWLQNADTPPKYTGLEALQQKFKDKGFTVLGFPCNQFGAQEPGTVGGNQAILLVKIPGDFSSF